MAVVLAFRLAIYLAGRGTAQVYTATGAGGGASLALPVAWLRERLAAGDSDEEISAALSDRMGYSANVATYTGAFELRKLHAQFSQQDAVVAAEDARVMTFHLAKVSGGAVVATWDGADFTAANAAFDTFWGAIKDQYSAKIKLDRLKYYKAGPAIEPPQIPVHDADRDVAGASASDPMPPQVAITVTEMAGAKPYWGRFYLPPPTIPNGDAYGRIDSGFMGQIADATDALYEAWKTAGLHPVVYRAALPVREKKNGVELPARDASAWDVEKIQVDDIFDVIRSRRFKQPLLRVQREIA